MARILLVDDSETARGYYREILTAAGHEVAEAANGYEGLEQIQLQDYDLIIVDVNMPRMDGYSLLQEVRRGVGRALPAIIISTEGGEEDINKGYRSGCNLYLVKPVLPADLEAYAALLG